MNIYKLISAEACGIAVTVNADRTGATVRCLKWGRTWQPKIQTRGRLESGWHRCPAGCNVAPVMLAPEFAFADHKGSGRRR
jgi:hypothetical protein